ncbi:hypothetical protein D3C86_2128550 [compost metagenome]
MKPRRRAVSMSSAVAAPSWSIHMASLPAMADMRLVVRPGVSLTTMAVLPSWVT